MQNQGGVLRALSNAFYFSEKSVKKKAVLGSDTDLVFCYQIALWASGECEIVDRAFSLSVQNC